MIASVVCVAVTPAKLKEAFGICWKVLEVFKLNTRILLAVQISFVDPVVGQSIKR
jgi:hypothetical protein